MKLDATDLRYVTADEFRVLKAFELGSRNHEVVPTVLAAHLSGLRTSNVARLISELAKRKLVARVQNARYDGYRLTYGGFDFLAVRALSKQDVLGAVGYRVGVGKESDIYITEDTEGQKVILKIHRLGRISFRNVKHKRDYLGNRHTSSWQYLSKLSASKEYLFMTLLKEHGFPVPKPLGHSRHAIVMERIDYAYPLRQIVSLPAAEVASLYTELMALIVRLAKCGLIHGDFNEFNLMIREKRASEYDDEAGAELAFEAKQKRETKQGLQRPHVELEEPENRRPIELRPGERIEQGKGFERVVNDASEAEYSSQDESDSAAQDALESADDEAVEGGVSEAEDEAGRAKAAEQQASELPSVTISDGTSVEAVLIDFPQMVSVEHENAGYYFDRDVECIKRFFRKRFRFEAQTWPVFADVVPADREQQRTRQEAAYEAQRKAALKAGEPIPDPPAPVDNDGNIQLDKLAEASGFGAGSRLEKELQENFRSLRLGGGENGIRAAEIAEHLHGLEEPGDEISQLGEEGEQNDEGDEPLEEEEVEHLTRAERRARAAERNAKAGVVPSRGAAEKAAREGDTSLITLRVAAERARKENKAAKHHGKKAQGAKVGRRNAGGKGRNDAIAIDTQF